MYGIFTYIWPKFMVNVGKYTIHGAFGIYRKKTIFGLSCADHISHYWTDASVQDGHSCLHARASLAVVDKFGITKSKGGRFSLT